MEFRGNKLSSLQMPSINGPKEEIGCFPNARTKEIASPKQIAIIHLRSSQEIALSTAPNSLKLPPKIGCRFHRNSFPKEWVFPALYFIHL